MLSVGTDLRQILLQDQNLANLVETNIFPLVVPDGTKGDFVTIRREHYQFRYTKLSPYDEIATLGVYACSPDYDHSLAIAEALRTAIVTTRVNGVYLRITDSDEEVTDFTVAGQTWYVQYLQVTAGNIDMG